MMEYYTTTKKNKPLPHAMTGMNLKNFIPGKRSQAQKGNNYNSLYKKLKTELKLSDRLGINSTSFGIDWAGPQKSL